VCPQASTTPRSTGRKAALVLEHLAEQNRHSIVLPRDRDWLEEISEHPTRLLSRMESSHLLYRVQRGRYVVAPRGTFSPVQAAPIELMVDLELDSQGEYFLSYLSALIAHRLTDLHSSDVYAAIRQESTYRRRQTRLPGHTLTVVRLANTRWPAQRSSEEELERVRALPGSKEFFWRATAERALVDALSRPELSAGIETVVTSWARAASRSTDWDVVCSIASRQGAGMSRRTAFMLDLLGLEPVRRQNFADLTARGAKTPLDRSNSFAMDGESSRDPSTGVVINVPREYLKSWAAEVATE
jgi:predicted transcriptional regulator of viral defense system